MKAYLLAALAVAQFTAQPAIAADLIDDRTAAQQRGAFAGARLRMPLGGHEKPHAGLAIASTRHGQAGTLGISSGMELGFAGDRKVRLSIAGKPIDTKKQDKAGVSTLGWVGIGVGVVAVTLGIGALAFKEAIACRADEECN